VELYYLDGSTPPDHLLKRFLELCEQTPGEFGSSWVDSVAEGRVWALGGVGWVRGGGGGGGGWGGGGGGGEFS